MELPAGARDDALVTPPSLGSAAVSEQPYFARDADGLYIPSELTRGPWDPGAQHAGPPSALLGGILERHERTPGDTARRLARTVLEILRPVPLAPLEVATRTVRGGRNVELLEAEMTADGVPVMLARGWRIATSELAPEAETIPAGPEIPAPQDVEPADPFFQTGGQGYDRSLEFRFASGYFLDPGPALAWTRCPRPILEGQPLSPLERVLVVADSGSGIGSALDWQRWLFINVDVAIHLAREPVGEWVGMDAETEISGDGIGTSETRLFDERGLLGGASQALLVRPRQG
ncbi:thioesterase family protein [Thermoleophilia bacterium SCSIO 60948]|nr:thioesterase family protein [Thermoleophilia bacterium SCSIO 60948]